MTSVVSPLRYENLVRDSIHRYKFKGMSRYAAFTASWWPSASGTIWRGAYD